MLKSRDLSSEYNDENFLRLIFCIIGQSIQFGQNLDYWNTSLNILPHHEKIILKEVKVIIIQENIFSIIAMFLL